MCSKIGRKTKQERREAPMFQYVIEMHSHVEWCVYTDVTRSVDALLAGQSVTSAAKKASQWQDGGYQPGKCQSRLKAKSS